MFTIDQIKAIHAKVKSGADFPNYVRELTQLGVTGYDHFVGDGHTEYRGKNNYGTRSEAKYAIMEVAGRAESEKLRHYLLIHQQGQTSYPEFCRHAAETGVEKWTVNMVEKTCTYYDKNGAAILVEAIP